MKRKEVTISGWHIVFFFAKHSIDDGVVLDTLYNMEASYDSMLKVNTLLKTCKENCGFTFSNPDFREMLVVIGPSSSTAQFLNTFVHELYHMAVFIAKSNGRKLDGESPAYISGDAAQELSDVVYLFGCAGDDK